MLHFAFTCCICLCSAGLSAGSVVAGDGAADTSPSAAQALPPGFLGAHFVPNMGQWSDPSVAIALRSRGLNVAFRDSSFTMHLTGGCAESDKSPSLTVTFPGSNDSIPEGDKPQSTTFNYFVGGENRNVASNIQSFGEVVYRNLYNGIDLHITGDANGILKYEFHVEPGADYSKIQIRYDGLYSMCIDDNTGDLHLNTPLGTLADAAPIALQKKGSSRDTIAARFELLDDHTYRIVLEGQVDPGRELIIDPEIAWMTYLGGRGNDYGRALAVEDNGDALIVGETDSNDFAGRINEHRGSYYAVDAFLARVDSSGQLLWMTYLGGTYTDTAYGIALDDTGNAFITGTTESRDFAPYASVIDHSRQGDDAFVAKVDADGQLQWVRYLGGSEPDLGKGIAVDGDGNAYATGLTRSPDFPSRNNAYHGGFGFGDSFVVKLNPDGQVQWMTYLGGSGDDFGLGIAVDAAGAVLATGFAASNDFEGRINNHLGEADAFAAKVSAAGQILWMRHLGGTKSERGYAIALDSQGNAVITGNTASPDFEGRNNEYHGDNSGNYRGDAFAASVDSAGQLQWMTYLGGRDEDQGQAIDVDSAGNALVTGYTFSDDFEGRINEFHSVNRSEAFAVRVDSSTHQGDWMMYLGGTGSSHASGAVLGESGGALITGYTDADDFEGHNNEFHGGGDAILVRLNNVGTSAFRLTVSGVCPGTVTIDWISASPDTTISLIFALNTGSFVVPTGPCQGTILGLGSQSIELINSFPSGSNGSGSRSGPAQSGACLGYLQLLDLATCYTSNVARIK